MKTRITLIAFLLFIVNISKAEVYINMILFCNEGEKFTLILNGQKYNDIPATSVKVTGLTLYKYEAKVIFENRRIKDASTTITFFKNYVECTFALNKYGKKFKVDYLTSVPIELPNSSGQSTSDYNEHSNEQFNNSGPQLYSTTPQQTNTTNTSNNTSTNTPGSYGTSSTPPINSNNSNSFSINVKGVNLGMNQNGGLKVSTKEGGVNLNAKDQSGNLSIGSGTNSINLNKVAKVPKVGCTSPVSDIQFDPIKTKISNQTSDANKLITAETLMENNCFSCAQVKTMMQMFGTDSSKLEFAKKAYIHTNDIDNYHRLKDLISDKKMQKTLDDYIHDQK